MIHHVLLPLGFLDAIGGAFDFIFHQREAVTGGVQIGGPEAILPLIRTHLEISGLALASSLALALPAGLVLGHRGKGELFAVAVGNAGRAVPELAAIAFLVAYVGTGFFNLTITLMILGIPPILTNTFVAVRQVDRDAVEAARGMGMRESQVIARVELPLAIPTIMSGVRTAAINIVATATIAPLAGVLTLGDLILNNNVNGPDGVLAGAILVALLALTVELVLATIQRALTPQGLKLQRAPSGA